MFDEMDNFVKSLNISSEFNLDLDYFDDDSIPAGKVFSAYEPSKELRTAGDVLEDTLNQLAERFVFTDVSTDGDNHDCEAIFWLKGEDAWLILKVR